MIQEQRQSPLPQLRPRHNTDKVFSLSTFSDHKAVNKQKDEEEVQPLPDKARNKVRWPLVVLPWSQTYWCEFKAHDTDRGMNSYTECSVWLADARQREAWTGTHPQGRGTTIQTTSGERGWKLSLTAFLQVGNYLKIKSWNKTHVWTYWLVNTTTSCKRTENKSRGKDVNFFKI